MDYALVSNVEDYRYHKIEIPRVDTNHRMIVVGLKSDNENQHRMYTKRRKKFNLIITDQTRGDKLIKKLQKEKQRKVLNNDHRIISWISDTTWTLIDSKAEARRIGNTIETKQLKKLVQKALG